MKSKRHLLKLTILMMLLVFGWNLASAQKTAKTISARLTGQPLYLRGCWGDNDLKFDAGGQPTKKYRILPFTESGIDVSSVKISHGRLHIEGQRVAILFDHGSAQRIAIRSANYNVLTKIEIESPSSGDFSKALDAIFAPDLANLVPTMPDYWQDYARKHLLTVDAENGSGALAAASEKPTAMPTGAVKHLGSGLTKPVVISSAMPRYSEAARVLKTSGDVLVYLWVMENGSISHLRIAKAAGVGLDEEALIAVSQYKFKPAMLDGKPVKVDLYVDVNFRIF